MMRVTVACDHGGFPLKETVLNAVRNAGHDVLDVGTFGPERVDYPDFTEKAGRAIQEGRADRGIVICGSGVGACIAANKMKGIFAAICHDTYSAHQGVEHDNMNVLCLGARIIGVELASEIIQSFLSAEFLNEGRYLSRLDKVMNLESSR